MLDQDSLAGQASEALPEEEISLSMDEPAGFIQRLHAHIAVEKSKTDNKIAQWLVASVILSLPVIFFALACGPVGCREVIKEAFDRWITLVGPLVGAAVGVGVIAKREGGR